MSTTSTTGLPLYQDKFTTSSGEKFEYKLKPIKDEKTGHETYKAFIRATDSNQKDKWHPIPFKWDNVDVQEFKKEGTNATSAFPIQVTPRGDSWEARIFRHSSATQPSSLTMQTIQTTNIDSHHTTSTTTSTLSLTPPKPPRSKRLDFTFIENTLQLALALHRRRPNNENHSELQLLYSVAEEIARKFNADGSAFPDIYTELAPLLCVLNDQIRRSIIDKVIREIDESRLGDKIAVEGLTDFLRILQRSRYKKALESVPQKTKPVIQTLDANDLIQILKLLIEKINPISFATSRNHPDLPPCALELEAFIICLEIMLALQVKDVEREKHYQPIYEVLDTFDLDPNLQIAFLAAYGKQILARIPNDETTLHSFLRHGYYIVKGLASLALAVVDAVKSHSAPAAETIIDALMDLKQGITKVHDKQANWYEVLFHLNQSILFYNIEYTQSLELLFNTAREGKDQAAELVAAFPTHNYFFVFGFVRILKQVVRSYAELAIEAGQSAIRLLVQIYKDNITNIRQNALFNIKVGLGYKIERLAKKDIPALLEKGKVDRDVSYSFQLKNDIYNFFHECATHHPALAIQKMAGKAIDDIEYLDPNDAKNFHKQKISQPTPFPTSLFDEIIESKNSWQVGFRNMARVLFKDPQLVQGLQFYIDSDVTLDSSGLIERKSLKQHVKAFLSNEDPNKVLLITGSLGLGKTIGIKKVAKGLWENGIYNGYLPVYMSLSSLAGDRQKAIDETLSKFGLDRSKSELQRERYFKILWIFDSVDELKDPFKSRIYDQTAFFPNSKTIFLSRSNDELEKHIALFYPDEVKPTGFKRLYICPFDRTKIEMYLDKYIKACYAEGSPALWTKQQYIDYLDSDQRLKDTISTPLYLYLMAETLPRIVALRQADGTNPKDVARIVTLDLLDAFFCITLDREERKQRRSNLGFRGYPKEDYLKYAVEMAKVIQKNGTLISDKDAREKYPELFNDEEKTQVMQRCNFLVNEQGQWKYRHEAFYSYFVQISGNPTRHREVEILLTSPQKIKFFISDQPHNVF